MDYKQIFNLRNKISDIDSFKSLAEFPSAFLELINTYEIERIKNKDLRINIPNRGDFIYLLEFLSVEEIEKTNHHFHNTDVDDILVSNKLFVIANTSASIFICIGTKRHYNFGEIFIYGWDLGLIKIANNLDQFLDSLVKQID